MSNREVVKVSQLNKAFMSKNGVVKAIDNVSFTIKKGEIVGLIGESGSGKTTIGRSLLRLHIPDSGSIEISGKEYASKKISKKDERSLRNNAQMIFQDPYSSLNGQKNILHIISEPLKVNGTDKKMVNEYLEDRSEMLVFFSSTLNSYFYETKWAHKELKYTVQIEAYKKIIKELEEMQCNKNDVKLSLFNIAIGIYYKTLSAAHTQIINSSSDNLHGFFNKWKELREIIKNEAVSPWDEIALLKAKKEYKLAKENIKASKATRELELKIQKLKEEVQELENEEALEVNVSSAAFSELIEQHKLEMKESKINMPLASTYGTQNFLNASIAKDKKIIQVLSKTLNNDKKFILIDSDGLNKSILHTVTVLYKKIFDKYKQEAKDPSIAKRKYADIHEEIFAIEWDSSTPYFEFLKEATIINDKKIEELENDKKIILDRIEKYNEELKELINKDQLRNKEELAKKLKEAEKKLAIAKADNKKERIDYQENYIKEFAKLKEEKELKLTSLETELEEVKAKATKVYAEKFDFIESFETDFLISEDETMKNESELKKLVDNSTKDKKDKNSSLVQEHKRLDKYQGIVKELFGMKKAFNLRGRLKKLLVRLEVFATLQHAGLQPAHAFRYPHEFSGGMRQRVGIARAIINKPDFIIADEPIAALDLSIQAQVVNMLLEQKERLGLAMLFIAHDLSMVRFNSDRILIMHLGKLVEYGETEEIFNNPKHPYTINLIKTMPSLNNLAQGFKDSTFIPEYLKEYSMSNRPFYVQVGDKDHFVLADKKQAKKWVGSIIEKTRIDEPIKEAIEKTEAKEAFAKETELNKGKIEKEDKEIKTIVFPKRRQKYQQIETRRSRKVLRLRKLHK
ncbi:MAG: ATP-binding cassette domain-containing protein [Mycoplasmatales bacterium]|nr:ATP-binding cassette domain-containing protein [Mycoplasmatales bacterium]